MQYCQPAPDFLPDPEAACSPASCRSTPAAGPARTRLRRRHRTELARRHHRRGLQQHPLRRRGHAHLFWRNLIDPYAREWQNGCSRWDLLDVVRCTWALRPEGITWPQHDDGRPSFKLEHLTAANDLAHEAAHDALSDVRATIALARLIKRAQQPRLWDFCLKLRERRGARRDGRGQALPAPVGHVPGGARLPGRGLAAGAAPDQQERGHRLGPGAGPGELAGWTPTAVRAAHVHARTSCPRRAAAAHQDHPHQQVAHRHRQPEDPGRCRRALGHRRGCRRCATRRRAALGGALDALWPEVFTRPAQRGAPMSTKTCTAASSATRTVARCSACANCSPANWPHASRPSTDGRLDELLFPLPRAQLRTTR
jgi:exodeoxyribonuclease-1